MSAEPMYYDASKAVRDLGLPQSNLDDAIVAAIDWFERPNPPHLVRPKSNPDHEHNEL
jgi:hypothetical protein